MFLSLLQISCGKRKKMIQNKYLFQLLTNLNRIKSVAINPGYSSTYGSVNCAIRKISNGQKPIPRPVVICGPSGSGKSTLLNQLSVELNDLVGFCISRELIN